MTPLRVQTAQNVDLAFATAGLGNRILAWLADITLVVAYVYLASVAFAEYGWRGPGSTAAWVLIQLPAILYHLLFEVFMEGQTPGKRLLKLRVARLDGAQPTLGQFLLRWLLRWVDVTLTSGVAAVISIGVTPKGQRLGDLAAGTTVVKVQRRVRLGEVRYHRPGPDYAPVFPQAEALDDADVRTLRAVLVKVRLEKRSKVTMDLSRRAKKAVEERLGLGPVPMHPLEFLQTVVQDYTAAHDRYA